MTSMLLTPQIPPPGTEVLDTLDLGRKLTSMLDVGPDAQVKVLLSVAVILLVWLIRRLVLRIVERNVEDVRARYQWAKTSGYVGFLLVVLVVGEVWLKGVASLGTFLGLLAAGLAIALKDLVANLAGWVFILWRRPLELGDRVQIGDFAGDVADIRIFQFTLLEIGNWVDADQSTGRIVHVPNAKLFNEPLANYTAQFEYIWNEVSLLVTFESNWKKAREILERIAQEKAAGLAEEAEGAMKKASRRVLIFYPKLTPIVYLSVKDSGILLTLRYLCRPRQRRGMDEGIWTAVLEAFAEAGDIDLAYPTRRVYHNILEGKEELRAEPPTWARLSRRSGEGDAGGSAGSAEAATGSGAREEEGGEGRI